MALSLARALVPEANLGLGSRYLNLGLGSRYKRLAPFDCSMYPRFRQDPPMRYSMHVRSKAYMQRYHAIALDPDDLLLRPDHRLVAALGDEDEHKLKLLSLILRLSPKLRTRHAQPHVDLAPLCPCRDDFQ